MNWLRLFALLMLLCELSACSTHRHTAIAPRADIRAAEQALGLSISDEDFVPLYLEAASWIGTPHRLGAATKQRGADCSGMTMAIYRDVYGKQLERSSAAMCAKNCILFRDKKKLREGDLLFFKLQEGGPVSHVGIYLKEGCFIHVSSKRGARVDRIDHPYYVRTFYRAGRVR